MAKVNCTNCSKELEISIGSDTSYWLGCYRGNPLDRRQSFIILCETCFITKEQEYLDNYEEIRKQTEKEASIFIKNPQRDCYANKKGSDGNVLKQKDCRHCQPWKFPNDNDYQEKCANCDKILGAEDTKYFGNDGKILCSSQCVDIHNKKNKNIKVCLVCGKDISNQEITYSSKGTGKERKNYCSVKCLRKGTPSKNNPPKTEPPPKSPNNNKGISTEIKVILGIGAIVLIIIIVLIGISKSSRKKTS